MVEEIIISCQQKFARFIFVKKKVGTNWCNVYFLRCPVSILNNIDLGLPLGAPCTYFQFKDFAKALRATT